MSAAPFGFGRLWPVIPASPDDEATPVGLAPGQMPVDPRRDGSVQPTAAGKNLSRAVGVVAGNAAQGLLDAGRLPGDVYAGRIDPMSDEGRKRAFDLAGTLATGGMPMAEAGAAGIFGGRLSRAANKEALAEAQDLAAQGIGRKDIWADTGWFQGPDRQWRHEIPDDASRYSGRGSTLGEALDHPDAFGAYPGLARIGHSQSAALADDTLGFYYPRHRSQPERIEVAQASAGEGLTAAQQHNTALHEVQHAVQAREGTLGTIDPKASRTDDWFSWPEIEARNVEARRSWSDAERRSVPPWESAERSWPQPHSRDAYPDHPMIDEANPIGRASSPPPAATADNPLAALEAMLGNMPTLTPEVKPTVRQVDPTAARWDLYHGSDAGADFARFDPSYGRKAGSSEAGALFLTPDAQQAGFYASGAPVAGAEAGPRIYRTTVEPGKTRVFDIPDLIENDVRFGDEARAALLGERSSTPTARDIASADALRNAYRDDLIASRARGREINRQLAEMGMEPGPLQAASYGHGYLGAAIKRAKGEGLDTAIIRGLEEQGGHDQIVALTPGRVRSYYAPDQLLYAGAPIAAGLAGAAALAPGDAQATPSPSGAPMAFGFGSLSGLPADVLMRQRQGMPEALTLGDPVATMLGPDQAPARPPVAAQPQEQPVAAPFGFGALAPRAPASAAPGMGFGPGSPGAGLPLPPQEPAATGATVPADRPAPRPAASLPPAPPSAMTSAPLPPARPPEFGSSADPEPPLDIKPKGAAAATAGPSAWDGISSFLGNNSDMLIGIGTGLMSTPGFGRGLAAGVQQGVAMQNASAAQGLARAKQAVEMQKLQQGQRSLTANAQFAKNHFAKLGTPISDDFAMSVGSTPEVFNKILTGQFVAPEGYNRGPDGALVPVRGGDKDPATIRDRAQAQAAGTAAGKPDETYTILPEERRVAMGLPAGSYQVDSKNKVSPVNPTGTTINMGAEKAQDATVGKGYGDYQLDLATKGRNAASTLNTLALMEQAMKTPGFYSGVGGEGVKRANQFLSALGVKDARAASAAEVFDALSNKVVLDGLGGSLGPGISNTDRDYIARTAPTLAQSEQGNRDLIGIARALAQRQQAVSKLARDYAGRNGGRLDSGFDQALEDFAASNPLFPQASAGAAASPPQEAPQGAPQGTRRGADGSWYAPDPRRPGKYLRVEQ